MREHYIKYPAGNIKVACDERRLEKEDTAANLNHLLNQATKFQWPNQYRFALLDLQKRLKFKGTYLELIK